MPSAKHEEGPKEKELPEVIKDTDDDKDDEPTEETHNT